jgi:hypothetical protein
VTYTAPDGAVYNNSGQYTAIIPNNAGCDSTISINLTINNASSSTQNESAIDIYTWPVNGQTYTESGIYTETLINSFGCDSVITLNLSIESSSIIELNGIEIRLSPNPFRNSLIITSDEKFIGVSYEILNETGMIVALGEIKTIIEILDLEKLTNGIYFFKLKSEENKIIRLVKK